jgi:hypothetical protein
VRPRIAFAALTLASVAACNVWTIRRNVADPGQVASLDHRAPFLKAHQRDGSVYVLRAWVLDSAARVVRGTGTRLDVNRRVVASGDLSAPLDSTLLLESNIVSRHGSQTAMTIMTVVSAALTVTCLSNPKACFGSCPTFYVSDGQRPVLQAEGFSASIAPALEATDVDALYRARPAGRALTVTMTNEAYETHVVRYVDVLAAPRPPNGRVFATDDHTFWNGTDITSPSSCRVGGVECTWAVTTLDGTEWYDRADTADLGAREVIDLEFPSMPAGRAGLVIGSRQTLLTTFLMYQTYAWLGSTLGEYLARLQRGDLAVLQQLGALSNALGQIEVQVPDAATGWRTVGLTSEVGPIAEDVRVVPLPPLPPGVRQLRLRLTKGLWRIDYVAVAALDGPVQPARLRPLRARKDGHDDVAVSRAMRERTAPLTTMVGDRWDFEYELPPDFRNQELFLETRGYYLEWLRDAWVAEEDAARASGMLNDPRRTFRDLAPAFKRLEGSMEQTFWSSRYVHP